MSTVPAMDEQKCDCCAFTVTETMQCESCANWVCNMCMTAWDGCCMMCQVTFPGASPTASPSRSPMQFGFPDVLRSESSMVTDHSLFHGLADPGFVGDCGPMLPFEPPMFYSTMPPMDVAPWEPTKDDRNMCVAMGFVDVRSTTGSSTRYSGSDASSEGESRSLSPKPSRSPSKQGLATASVNISCGASNECVHGSLEPHRQGVISKPRKQQGGVANTPGKATTMMICNLPCRLNYNDIVGAINSVGFADTYEFVHLPQRAGQVNSNLGYAFVNFRTPEDAAKFAVDFEDHRFVGTHSTKTCKVKVADHQGFNAYVAQMCRRRKRQ